MWRLIPCQQSTSFHVFVSLLSGSFPSLLVGCPASYQPCTTPTQSVRSSTQHRVSELGFKDYLATSIKAHTHFNPLEKPALPLTCFTAEKAMSFLSILSHDRATRVVQFPLLFMDLPSPRWHWFGSDPLFWHSMSWVCWGLSTKTGPDHSQQRQQAAKE